MAGKPADAGEDAPKASGGSMIGLVILAVGAIGASFGTVFLLTPSAAPAIEAGECAPVEVAVPQPNDPIPLEDQRYVEIPEILITIGSSPSDRYLKLNLTVITDRAHIGDVEDAKPVLIDAFNTYLRAVEPADFEAPGFYPRMRDQLSRRAELVLGDAASDGVLITEFLLR